MLGFNSAITIDTVTCYAIASSSGVSPQMAIGGMPTRPALLLRICDKDGCSGWGEVWANFPPRAHIHKQHIIEDVIAPQLQGVQFIHPEEIQQYLYTKLSVYFLHVGQAQVFDHIVAGIDIALWDLSLRKHNYSAIDFFELETNQAPCYASSINADDIDTMIPKAISVGQKCFKIKVGFQADNGKALIQRAGQLATGSGRIAIDSNQSWSLQQATDTLNSLQSVEPLFAEEPIRADAPLRDWETLAKRSGIPLAAGENVYGIDRFVSMANAGISVVQPDVAKWGGVSGILALSHQLPETTKLWPHFMGTAIGQMASLALTSVIGSDAMCEMDVNVNPLRTELCGDIMQIENGCTALFTGAGLVVPPAAENLAKYQFNGA